MRNIPFQLSKTPLSLLQGRKARALGQRAIAVGLALSVLAGCAAKREVGQLGAVRGFIGGVVAEEPRATLVGRDSLSAGGTAADAVVAAFFTLTASYPLNASLASGGACVVYDAVSNEARTLDFLPRTPRNGGKVALPTALRAMAMLHATYGRLRWEQIVSPAERLARFGHKISRAFGTRLKMNEKAILADKGLAAIFAPNGTVLKEGDNLTQIELAVALTQLRAKGISALHGGDIGKKMILAANDLGGILTIEDMREYIPTWRKTISLETGNELLHWADLPLDNRQYMDRLREQALAAGEDIDAMKISALLSDYVVRTGWNEQTGLPTSDTAIAAVDSEGSGVACQFTMNGELGAGGIPADLGFLVSRAEPQDPAGTIPSPALAVNHNVNQVFLALAASGGAAASAQTAYLAAQLLEGGKNAKTAQNSLRAVAYGKSGPAAMEKIGAVKLAPKRQLQLGLAQVIWCPGGAQDNPRSCEFVTDPRGYGLASTQN